MLPSAKKSLEEGGLSSKTAAWVLILCFIVGAVGIQLISRIIHKYIPSHVVNCEHSHDEEDHDHKEHDRSRANSHGSKRVRPSHTELHHPGQAPTSDIEAQANNNPTHPPDSAHSEGGKQAQRPGLQRRLTKTLSMLSLKPRDDCACDDYGPCRGFTETCQEECFKIVQTRGSYNGTVRSTHSIRRPSLHPEMRHSETTPLLRQIRETGLSDDNLAARSEHAVSERSFGGERPKSSPGSEREEEDGHKCVSDDEDEDDIPKQHHHHVPNNAFLSIGLQTSIAIALHKLPEGFITYATNHANPQLGFSVFLALFIHNITEGFALALPLYLAIQSRWRAMCWSFLLGGCSQPIGAGIAALWFAIAGSSDLAPGERVYGAMFALTSGIMTSVALQLFSESLDLTHNRNLCMISAFVGMGIMGISSALTA